MGINMIDSVQGKKTTLVRDKNTLCTKCISYRFSIHSVIQYSLQVLNLSERYRLRNDIKFTFNNATISRVNSTVRFNERTFNENFYSSMFIVVMEKKSLAQHFRQYSMYI